MDRLDTIDPRLFVTLPEHVSNALYVWNRALFITQMSHLDSFSAYMQSSHESNSNTKSSDPLKETRQPYAADTLLEAYLNDCKAQFNSPLLSSSSDDDLLRTLNQTTLMKIFKIKKRNKASLLNLMPSLGVECTANNSGDCPTSAVNAVSASSLTPPWDTTALRPTSPVSSSSSSSDSSIDLCCEALSSSSASVSSQNEAESEKLCGLEASQEAKTEEEEEEQATLDDNTNASASGDHAQEADEDLNLNKGSKR